MFDQQTSSPTPIHIVGIIPTYNNAQTVASVVSETVKVLPDVIVVNDGATDNTAGVLAVLSDAHVGIRRIDFDVNQAAILSAMAKYVVLPVGCTTSW